MPQLASNLTKQQPNSGLEQGKYFHQKECPALEETAWVTIPGGVWKPWRCCSWGQGLVVHLAVLGEQLGLMISKVFSNPNKSMAPWHLTKMSLRSQGFCPALTSPLWVQLWLLNHQVTSSNYFITCPELSVKGNKASWQREPQFELFLFPGNYGSGCVSQTEIVLVLSCSSQNHSVVPIQRRLGWVWEQEAEGAWKKRTAVLRINCTDSWLANHDQKWTNLSFYWENNQNMAGQDVLKLLSGCDFHALCFLTIPPCPQPTQTFATLWCLKIKRWIVRSLLFKWRSLFPCCGHNYKHL